MSDTAQLPRVLGISSIYIDQPKSEGEENNVFRIGVNTDQGYFVLIDDNGDENYDSVAYGQTARSNLYLAHFQKQVPFDRVLRRMDSLVTLCENAAQRGETEWSHEDDSSWFEERKFTLANENKLRVEVTYNKSKRRYSFFCGEESAIYDVDGWNTHAFSLYFYFNNGSFFDADLLSRILASLGRE